MRPGGLTALAIFNFIFGGLGALSGIFGIALADQQLKALAVYARLLGTEPPSAAALYTVLGLAVIRAGLLIMSGVGYLGLKRFSGRIIGNTYAVLAFIGIILEATLLPSVFTAGSLIEFVYPLITLFLLNVIFRKDFVR
jgi:hypothetical protein